MILVGADASVVFLDTLSHLYNWDPSGSASTIPLTVSSVNKRNNEEEKENKHACSVRVRGRKEALRRRGIDYARHKLSLITTR